MFQHQVSNLLVKTQNSTKWSKFSKTVDDNYDYEKLFLRPLVECSSPSITHSTHVRANVSFFLDFFFLQCGKKLCYAIYHCSQTLTIYYYLFTIKWNCFWRSIHIHFPTPCNYAVCTSSFVSGFFFQFFVQIRMFL